MLTRAHLRLSVVAAACERAPWAVQLWNSTVYPGKNLLGFCDMAACAAEWGLPVDDLSFFQDQEKSGGGTSERRKERSKRSPSRSRSRSPIMSPLVVRSSASQRSRISSPVTSEGRSRRSRSPRSPRTSRSHRSRSPKKKRYALAA